MTDVYKEPGICRLCGHSKQWHEENHPRHRFDDPSTLFLKKSKGADRPGAGDNGNVAESSTQTARWPMDPVLRVALINAGVITPADLTAAEELIKATTVSFENTVRESRANGQ